MPSFDKYKTIIDHWFTMTDEERTVFMDWDESADGRDAAYIMDICFDILDDITMEKAKNGPEGRLDLRTYNDAIVEVFSSIIREGNEFWGKCVDYINETYGQDQGSFGFMITISTAIDMADKRYTTTIRIMRDALAAVLKEQGEKMFDEIDPITPLDEDDLKNIDKADPNLMYNFFNTFKELGKFNRNINDYTDPKQVELHKKLMAMYHVLTGS